MNSSVIALANNLIYGADDPGTPMTLDSATETLQELIKDCPEDTDLLEISPEDLREAYNENVKAYLIEEKMLHLKPEDIVFNEDGEVLSWENVVTFLDDALREEIHSECDVFNTPQKFFDEFCKRYRTLHSEEFFLNSR